MNNLDKFKIPAFKIKSIERISPSQYTSICKCAYRTVLKESLANPLLPPSPAALLGSIIHEMLELMAKREILDKDKFMESWEYLVTEKEKELRGNGLDAYIPLKQSVPYFAIKKLQTFKYLFQSVDSRKSFSNKSPKSYSEKWLESTDKKIGGYVDLILEGEKTKLIDFKTGKVLDDGKPKRIKSEYEVQLKLYAWLYFEKTGSYPDELWLVDLKQRWHSIPFKPEECELLADEARQMLRDISLKVKENQNEALASPSFETCQNCNFKPACKYYWKIKPIESTPFLDLKGTLTSVKKFQTGSLNLEIENEEGIYYIVNFKQIDFESMKVLQNQEIQISVVRNLV
jgi:hypothetical protein